MCNQQQCVERLTEATPYIRSEFGVTSMCLFGSMARGDNGPDSDADICVDMPPRAFKVVALRDYLQELLGMAVDLVRRNSRLDPFLVNEIERDGIWIFS